MAQTQVKELKEGGVAPDFTLKSTEGKEISLKDFRGKQVVLYFYPKDDTPGCTKEACDFRDNLARVRAKGAVVFGVSHDSVESHDKFKEKFDFRKMGTILQNQTIHPLDHSSQKQKKIFVINEIWGVILDKKEEVLHKDTFSDYDIFFKETEAGVKPATSQRIS